MKRKLTAVLLTLCMVLGMLPMSAFAVWTVDGAEKADLVAANEIDVDGNHYYLKEGETLKETYAEGDTLTYYTADKTGTITLVWRADGAGDVTHDDTHTVTWTDNSDGTHTSACGTAGCDYEPVTENHTFENGKCTVCGAVDPASIPTEKVEATVDEATGKVNVAVTITEQEASAAVDAAVGAAGTGETAVVTIPAVADTAADVKEVAVPIPETLVTAVADETGAAKDVAVAVETNLGKVSIPAAAIVGETGVTLTVSKDAEAKKAVIADSAPADDADETVTAEAVEAVKAAPVVSIDLTSASGALADSSKAPEGGIAIELNVGAEHNGLWMFWVDHVQGAIKSLKKIAGSQVTNGKISTTLEHLSDYVLLEDTTEEPPVDENGYYSLTVTQVAGANIVVKCDGETDENGYYAAGSTVTGKVTFVEGKTGKVTANGEEVAVDAEGNFSFTLNANTVVTAVVEDKTTVEEKTVTAVTDGIFKKYSFTIADGNILVYQTKDGTEKYVVGTTDTSVAINLQTGVSFDRAYECTLADGVEFSADKFIQNNRDGITIIARYTEANA